MFLLLGLLTLIEAKYFWAFIDSSMGFGDKIRFYYGVIMAAHRLGRTAVLPPFQIVMTDYSTLSSVDFENDGQNFPSPPHSYRA
jgi:hypothetical protein